MWFFAAKLLKSLHKAVFFGKKAIVGVFLYFCAINSKNETP